MNLELYLNKQNIDRYVRLLSFISDETQRRQIQNLLEEERAKVLDLQAGLGPNEAAAA